MNALPVSHILYLHGFRSSPRSHKARVVQERLTARGQAQSLICPQLPASPQAAMALALSLAERHAERLAIVGSSLGGFYATWLAERFGCRAVLINPAVDPLANLSRHVGVTTAWHSDEPFEFKPDYIDELAALKVARITQPPRYFLLAATGDEVLDYRDMVVHYAGARQHIIAGSDHAVTRIRAVCRRGAGFLLYRRGRDHRGSRRIGPGKVRAASLRRARWLAHAAGVGAPEAMRRWLASSGSLTARLIAHSRSFRVQKLRQAGATCLADEATLIGLPRARRVWEREVLLRCDGRPVVYGHTVVPLEASASDWPLFSALGERSLGSTLFYDPRVARGRLEFARIRPGHPLHARGSQAALGGERGVAGRTYFARRCLYRRRRGLLLVTEVFLPAVLDLAGQH